MKFSVVTPCFKQLDWLSLCVESVRDQAGVNGLEIEHIVQDAGSDGVEEFARKKGATFYRDGVLIEKHAPTENYSLTIYSERDGGMYDAINRGWKKCSGELTAYINCDEQYLAGTLSTVVGFFANHPRTEVLFGDVVLVDATGRAMSYRRVTRPNRIHTRLVHLGTLSCATFIRRSVIDDGFLLDPRWRAIGDAVWVDSLLRAGKKVSLLQMPLGTFTFTGENLSEANKGPNGEHARWAAEDDAPPQWLRKPSILHHRIVKLLNGAYRKRSFDYEIYTSNSPASRQRFRAENVGHGWPKG